jgi:predicted secreted protein
MSQALVYNANVANVTWNTDKAEIVTSSAYAIWNTYVMQAGNPIVGLIGTVQSGSNVMLTSQAAAGIVNGTFTTGTGVANTVTVSSVVNGQSLVMSANATASGTYQYTLTTANPGNMYNNSPIVSPNSRQQVYVGAGNKLTVTSSAQFTVREIGTASSAVDGN